MFVLAGRTSAATAAVQYVCYHFPARRDTVEINHRQTIERANERCVGLIFFSLSTKQNRVKKMPSSNKGADILSQSQVRIDFISCLQVSRTDPSLFQ